MRRFKTFHNKAKLMVWVRTEKVMHYIFVVLMIWDNEKILHFGNRWTEFILLPG